MVRDVVRGCASDDAPADDYDVLRCAAAHLGKRMNLVVVGGKELSASMTERTEKG